MILRLFLLTLPLLLALQSCSRVEGCNDPIARNYDAEADKNCCCEYYKLRFNVEHQVNDSTSLAYLTRYADALGDSFEVKFASLLISEISLIDATGNAFFIEDSVSVPLINGSNSWFLDDFIAIRPGTFINEVGSFTKFGSYSKIRFLVGLEGEAVNADGLDISDTKLPLSANHSSTHYNQPSNVYWFSRWEIIRPTLSDTLRFGVRDTVWVELNYPSMVVDGTNTDIPITVNYLDFFNTISFLNDDSTTVVQKLKINTRNAFSIQ
jgi:hypothetical protein